jgi:site-specific DNA-methyltransferase (adenine-specific)
MTTVRGETVLDPMCGSGTTGAACRELGRHAILCDGDDAYTTIVERRLGIRRRARRKTARGARQRASVA